MNVVEKRDFIHSHLHQVKEPVINKMLSLLHEAFIEESEEDIEAGNLTTHEALKREIKSWRTTK